jgi:hypothetical protein
MSTPEDDLADDGEESFEFEGPTPDSREERDPEREQTAEAVENSAEDTAYNEREEDTRLSADARGDAEEELAQQGETENERLLRNQENRRKKKLARARERQEREELRETNALLARRIEEQERTTTALRIDSLTANFNHALSEVERAEWVMKRAEQANNQIDWVKAKEVRDDLLSRARDLKGKLEQLTAPPPPRQQGPHPDTVRYGQLFAKRHPWFDWNAKDEDSAIVFGIDAALKKSSGLQPHQPEYWEELERRVNARLPNKTQRGNAVNTEQTRRTPTPPVGGGRSDGSPRSAGEARQIRFSAAERQALEEAGYWGDTEKMQKMRKQWDSAVRRPAGR